MQIILNEDESKTHLEQKVREAVLAETSKFPANMTLPEGCKLRPKPLTRDQKACIIELHEEGMARGQIARELRLPGRQVSGVVQAYINAKKLLVEPIIEGLRPMKPLVIPEAEKPPIEPTCSLCGKPLDHDRVAIGGKFYCKPCAPKKVPTMITRRPKPVKSNSEIDNLIIDMSKQDPLLIADEINRAYGGAWMPGDVTKRLEELRKA